MDPLKVLRHGVSFQEDPSKIDDSNHNVWYNLHITPALTGVMVEVRSLEEVTHWAKRKHLGSAPDPMEPGVANLIVALGNNPWPYSLGLARVLVTPDQVLCSLTEAMNSAKGILRERERTGGTSLLLNSSLHRGSLHFVGCRAAGRRWYCHGNGGSSLWS